MTLRIDVSEVGERIEEALASAAAGEEVVLERDGRPVAELKTPAVKPGGLRAFAELRARRRISDPTWIDAFAANVADGRELMNRPVEFGRSSHALGAIEGEDA